MKQEEQIKLSKFLSLVLRHKPEIIGLQLDEQAWAQTDELLNKAKAAGKNLSLESLKEIVQGNDKQRFGFNDDFSKIRARQGHSLQVDLQLPVRRPPALLYHGTIARNLPSIREKGLLSQQRQHVHLSQEEETALKVGSRYGTPLVLQVKAAEMFATGHPFYLSENEVWLTETVPPLYILFPA